MTDGILPDGAEQIGPWKRRSSRLAYENPWIRVHEDAVVHPDGSDGIYGVVEFRNTATGIIALDPEDHIFLIGQYRYPLRRYSWELPEGGCAHETGETPLEAAKRELAEEAGVEASEWNPLGTLALSNSVCDEIGHLFLARELRPVPVAPEASEILQIRRIPIGTAHEWAMEGKLTDSMTVAGIARAVHWLAKARNR